MTKHSSFNAVKIDYNGIEIFKISCMRKCVDSSHNYVILYYVTTIVHCETFSSKNHLSLKINVYNVHFHILISSYFYHQKCSKLFSILFTHKAQHSNSYSKHFQFYYYSTLNRKYKKIIDKLEHFFLVPYGHMCAPNTT